MPLITLKEAMEFANSRGCAIPAFNIDFMEGIEALVDAAEAEGNYPIILNIGQGAVQNGKLATLAALVRMAAGKTEVPIVIHLDHGSSYGQVIQCIQAGFTSVMIDGSHLTLEENIRLTTKVSEAAKAAGVTVEGELGVIGGQEDEIAVSDNDALMVNVEEIIPFTSAVELDALAVGIGNVHGLYKGEPKLDFGRLAEVRKRTDVPLVLHGGSGIPDEMIKKAISLGIRKINVATEIRHAYIEGVATQAESKDVYRMMGAGKAAMTVLAREKIQLFKGGAN